MAPDLNSLPPSRSIPGSPSTSRAVSVGHGEAATMRGQSPSPSSRSPSISLQAAAAVNAGLQHEDSRSSTSSSLARNRRLSHTGRRRSNVHMNLQLNDPSLPAPGEMINEAQTAPLRTISPQVASPIISSGGDPHHFRSPSLGEIHQELEAEQEAQVNRLLQMIRTQQQQLQQLQAASGQSQTTPSAIDESTPTSERSMSFSNQNIAAVPSATSTPRSPAATAHPRTSFDLQRRSRTPSRTASPRLRSTSISIEGESPGGRDEIAFYQAETQMMNRENQMLRQRIRELERQVAELHADAPVTNEPAAPPHLPLSETVSEETAPELVAASASATAPASTEVKDE